MRRVLVTGANKGIGLAIVRAILQEHDDTFVFLGSRDRARGEEAAKSLTTDQAKWSSRVEVVTIDVANDASVKAASDAVREKLGGEKLYGVVNNAGIANFGEGDLPRTLQTNTLGPKRVNDAFLPLLDEKNGRIVIVSSAAGPNFVEKCSPEKKATLLDKNVTWPRIQELIDESTAIGDSKEKLAARGFGDGGAYGLSKALVNAYTLLLAREHPALKINACTPGFIETDLTKPFLTDGKTGADSGMKPPSEGAKAPMHLLFGDLEGNGRYYGSDAKRSPLDRYRSPGSAPYTGD